MKKKQLVWCGQKAQKLKFLVVFPFIGQWKGEFTVQKSYETSENCKTAFPWCLQHPTKFQVKILSRKKVMENCALN